LSNAVKVAAPVHDAAPVVGPRLRTGWLVAMVLIIGTLQYLATSGQREWLYVLQRLYYIPVLLAGLVMGLRGGIGIALRILARPGRLRPNDRCADKHKTTRYRN